jgi:hypothetical protein
LDSQTSRLRGIDARGIRKPLLAGGGVLAVPTAALAVVGVVLATASVPIVTHLTHSSHPRKADSTRALAQDRARRPAARPLASAPVTAPSTTAVRTTASRPSDGSRRPAGHVPRRRAGSSRPQPTPRVRHPEHGSHTPQLVVQSHPQPRQSPGGQSGDYGSTSQPPPDPGTQSSRGSSGSSGRDTSTNYGGSGDSSGYGSSGGG